MSRKERTTIRRKNYRAWKQEQKTQSKAPAIAQPIEDNSKVHEPMSEFDLGDPFFDEAPQPQPTAPGHSTGPRTASGLARSSQNARKHGLSSLTSIFVMMPGEDPHEWVELVDDLNQEFQPATRTERILVNDMAQSHWLTQRAINLQTSHIEDPKFFALYLRYQTTHHRAYYRALKQLVALQKERAKSGTKPLVIYSQPTSDQIVLNEALAEPHSARSGAGSPDPRWTPTSGSTNQETAEPQAA